MTLEKQFEQEMIGIYMTAKKECGYNPTRFLQLISTKGGIALRSSQSANPAERTGLLPSGNVAVWIYQ